MSTLAEIETAVVQLPRPDQGLLLQFLADRLRSTAEDETEYLLSSPANREHLLTSLENIAAGRNLVEPDQELFR